MKKRITICLLAMFLCCIVAAMSGKGSAGYLLFALAGCCFEFLAIGFAIALWLDPESKKTREERRAFQIEDNRPVFAKLISTEERCSKLRGLFRAAIGHALDGSLGAYAWAYTTSGTKYATFAVEYATGRIGTETVVVDGPRFRELFALHDRVV